MWTTRLTRNLTSGEVTTTNDDGEEETTTETVTETVLTIEITHKTAADMAQEYRFDRRQKEYLDLMMQPDVRT